jgi:uncharacterized protein
MKWESERQSDNVEDRRGFSGRGKAIGGGALLVAVVATLLGAPPEFVRSLLGSGSAEDDQQVGTPRPTNPADDKRVAFVKVVLGSTEDVWASVLPASGKRYLPPKLVLFSDEVQSACGRASAASGPFYCPPDKQVYLDLSFFHELEQRFGAPGDFAQAYVIGHEVGHHVQNLLGISGRTMAERQRSSPTEANKISVETELQADCLAGVWAYHANKTRHMLEPGDVDEAIRAATAIGDDTLQKASRGRVVPESFTHGSSAQRVRWLNMGLKTGRVEDCDTFSTTRL